MAGVELRTGVVARRSPRSACSSPAASASTSSLYSPCRGSSARASRACRGTRRGSSRLARMRASKAASGRGPPATASCRRSSSGAGDAPGAPRRRRDRALAGRRRAPDPGEPVLHGRLLVGHEAVGCAGRGDAEGAPCGGRRARSPASTCRAGWRARRCSARQSRCGRRGRSPFVGRWARCAARKRSICSTSRTASQRAEHWPSTSALAVPVRHCVLGRRPMWAPADEAAPAPAQTEPTSHSHLRSPLGIALRRIHV